ncbi:MAG: ATP phosphoribosyltransferase regulatory subunit [Candidatus Micrarchaeota archaeon]|nr:ATP phosphoribosyltransferase regulatory subunit [Candidatus Micrarchaeota archaeon]
MRAEAELVACACSAISELGFEGATVLLNDRRIITKIAQSIISGKEGEVLRILDKREKIGDEAAVELLVAAGADKAGAKKLISALTSVKGNEEALAVAGKYSSEAAQSLKEIISLLDEYGKIDVKVDLSLVRGLDYYTGRYDNLLSMYGQSDCAVGISLGFERLMTLAGEKKLEKSGVFVACVKDEFYQYALSLASKFREAGVCAQTDLNGRNLKKQMEYAADCCQWIAIVGEREKKEGKVTLRNLESGKEELLSAKQAIERMEKKN